MGKDKDAGAVTEKIGIRHIPPKDFHWQVLSSISSNPKRAEIEMEDIRDTGMECCGGGLYLVDLATRYGLGFSLRSEPNIAHGEDLSYEKNPEYYRIDIDGKPAVKKYSGGRPTLGVSHIHPEQQAILWF